MRYLYRFEIQILYDQRRLAGKVEHKVVLTRSRQAGKVTRRRGEGRQCSKWEARSISIIHSTGSETSTLGRSSYLNWIIASDDDAPRISPRCDLATFGDNFPLIKYKTLALSECSLSSRRE